MDCALPALDLNLRAEALGWPMRCDAALAFERQELSDLCALWRARAEGGVPQRSAFGMRVLKPYARNLLILERQGESGRQRYRFRLFGSSLALLFGEHTGRFLDEMVAPGMLPVWLAFYDCVLAHAEPFRFINYYRIPSEDYLKGEFFAAPMADEDDKARLILAATFVGLKDVAQPPFG